jgi:hypothetical protein
MRATSVLANAKSKAHQDASSKAAWPGWKAHVLTQGGLLKREREQESAEAIVVMMPSESSAERRAEGATAKRAESLWTGTINQSNVSRLEMGEPLHTARTRTAGMVQPSYAARRETCRITCDPLQMKQAMQEIRISRVNPRFVSTAGCGKPHVRWCGSLGGRKSRRGDPIFQETQTLNRYSVWECTWRRNSVSSFSGDKWAVCPEKLTSVAKAAEY